ncbi:Branched-chain amino acid ABC transporter, permease protein [Lactobacillus kimbladii]|uniref:Branched-chain amino acid ABC transporter, permease protein n=2 Tax=Lactobacillaceae TaxID=33958 RepID=A0A0F4LNK2_9LACO|nr:Branched-chain amino acid ABC transporter, amino acid-binding protein [Lactobacillus sp. wkB10]KJY59883.1 Branched-chain amino acid ABC transporter, permease protein [Lactobacillus kimbladii]
MMDNISGIKKIMNVVITGMAAFMLAGCTVAKSSSGDGTKQDKDSVKIGVNMELSGAAAGYGNAQKQGIQLAVSEINKKGGIDVNGRKKKIKLIMRDNKTAISTSASVAAQLATKEKVAAIVGPATTNAGTAEIPNITKAKVPSVSPSATDPNYTLQKNGKVQPFVFRACYQNNFQGGSAAKFVMNNIKAKRVAVYTDNSSDYGNGLAKAFKKTYKGKIVDSQTFSEGDKDFNAVLTSFKAKKVDAIYVPGYYTEVGLIIKQARQIGIKAPIVGSDGMADPKLVQIAGAKNASKIYYTTPFSTQVAAKDPTASKFMRDFKNRYHEEAPTFSALAYDAVYMIKEAIENEKSDDSAKITKGLEQIKDFTGVTGKITVDKDHNPEKPIAVEELINGKVGKTFKIE